jgi:hypothetical protein
MSQNGRREFLTSAAAVAAALAACTAPARRAQAQPPTCKTMYDENDIVPKVAHLLAPGSHTTFRQDVLTFTNPPVSNNPKWTDLTPPLADHTLGILMTNGIPTVTVKRGNSKVPVGEYQLVSWGTPPVDADPLSTPPKIGKRSPVVLTIDQEKAGGFTSSMDLKKILLFVIPDPKVGGHDSTEDEAKSAMCVHPYGM